MNNGDKLIYLKPEELYPHPDNPRLDIGDISELVESVKANGILQNLTVIPGRKGTPEEMEHIKALREKLAADDKAPEKLKREALEELDEQIRDGWVATEYTVLIGHRRLAAAKAAGLETVPCKILNGTNRNDQISIMLQENMQRNDLTIFEQAKSFQLMLDLGETVNTLAEKTGFSETTIRHRVKMGELDQKLLKQRADDEGFQLNLIDLYELEKVEDPEKRNEILTKASSSNDMRWRIRNAVLEQTRSRNYEKLKKLLRKAKILKAPDGVNRYSSDYELVKCFVLDNDIPEEISIKEKPEEVVWVDGYGGQICLMKKKKRVAREQTEYDRKAAEDKKKRKQLMDIIKTMERRRQEFIQEIVAGKVKTPHEVTKNLDSVLRILTAAEIKNQSNFLSESSWYAYVLGKKKWEVKPEERDGRAFSSPLIIQHLVIAGLLCENSDSFMEYPNLYKPEWAAGVKLLYDALEIYGYQLEEDERKVLDGTHELYGKWK